MTTSQGCYKHLSHEERKIINRMRTNRQSVTSIATALGRPRSTIHREIKRNIHDNGRLTYYTHSKANEKANGRSRRPRKTSKLSSSDWTEVERRVRLDWSPEQVSETMKMDLGISISHESVYQHIYKDKDNGGTLYNHLRHRFRKRRKRYRSKDRRGRLTGKRMIGERPPAINERKEIGHWEIDTVVGTGSKACLVTIVERVSGFVAIGRLKDRTVESLNTKVIEMIYKMNLPVLSITSDNGSEFHGYKIIEEMTGVTFYFANPHHSWERGTNENTNGLIRQYIQKGKSMRWICQKKVNQIAQKINQRPRKRHNFISPLAFLMGAA